MKSLYLIRGCPGSGKTTFANEMSEYGKYPIISADMFFEDFHGNYNWDASKIKDAHIWCYNETERVMSIQYWNRDENKVCSVAGYCNWFGIGHNTKIFVANTFTTDSEMEPYYELAEKYGYKVFSIIVENRHNGTSIHDVPNETMEKMRNRFSIKL